ncbi:MAG TPA: hypothetical protein VN673_03355 [Clostridia bacterium]|nr:hypothetical protein [Clostridia bacterium]
MDSATQIKGYRPSSALALPLLLAGMVSFGGLLVAADSRGWLDILGWRKSPGMVLIGGLFLLTVILLRLRFAVCRTLCVVALFGSSIVIGDRMWLISDIVRLPAWFWLLAALSAPLIGVFSVYQMRVALALQAAFAVLGGYIQAVHMYNALHPGEHMGFFGPGWIS